MTSLRDSLDRFRQHVELRPAEAQAADETARRLARQDRQTRLRQQSGIPPRFSGARLVDLDYDARTSPAIDMAAQIIDGRWKDSLALYGSVGPGKTTIAAAILNAALEELVPTRMLTVVSLFDSLHHASKYGNDAEVSELINDFARIPVLLLDDLGREPMQSRQYLAWLYELLNRRWNECHTLIVTSNFTLDGLADRYCSFCARVDEPDSTAFSIIDRLARLVPHGQWVAVNGPSRRLKR